MRLAGISVHRQVYLPEAAPQLSNGFMRYLDVLTNDTNQPISVNVRLGSPGGQSPNNGGLQAGLDTVWRTQSDDPLIEMTDRWFLIDDENAFGGLPSVGVINHGAGALYQPVRVGQNFGDDPRLESVGWDFDEVVIPPETTVAFMTIVTLDPRRDDTLEELDSLLRVRPVDVLAHLSDAVRDSIVNFDVNALNASPVANAGGPYTANEGQVTEMSGISSYDTETPVLLYGWDLIDDGQLNFGDANTANFRHTFPDDGVFQIRLRVEDGGGKVDIDSARVQVLNVEPRIDGVATSGNLEEGGVLEVEVDAFDPGADVLTYQFDWDGDGRWDTEPNENARGEHLFRLDGEYTGRVLVSDGDGGRSEATFDFIVANAAPNILQIIAPPGVAEGSTFDVRVLAQDPGGDAMTFAYDIDGDGVFDRTGEALDVIQVRYDDDGLRNFRVRVCDSQGACSVREAPINVGNIRPVIESVTAVSPIDEGGITTITVQATDVVGDSLSYAFDFDNDGDYVEDIDSQLSPSAQVQFTDDGRFIVGVRVDDGDGGRTSATVEVVVRNVVPVAELNGPAGTRQGLSETFVCTATDPGADRLSLDWDMDGDGQFERLDTLSEQTYVFQDVGLRTVRCRVRDGDGGEVIAEHRIFVANEVPTLQLIVDSPQNEGAEVVIRAVGEDAGGDDLVYRFDVDGDGQVDYGPSPENIVRHVYAEEGEYTIRAYVSDGTDETDASARVLIVNVPPLVRLTSNTPVNEGDVLRLAVEVSDAGGDAMTILWDVDGDGAPDEEAATPIDGPLVQREMMADDNGRYDVRVWVSDEDGGTTESATAVVINNLPPSFPDGYQPPDAREGQPYLRAIPAFDPAGQNDPIQYSLIGPPAGVDIEENTGLLLWTPTFRDFVNRPIIIRVRIDDGDGGTTQADLSFDIIPIDEDNDGLPDTWELMTCDSDGVCLDPNDPDDAQADPDNDGRDNAQEWVEGTDPYVYEGPSATRLLSPPDGERVPTLTPELITEFVESDRPGVLWVEYQVASDPEMEEILVESGPIAQADGDDTRWNVPADILEEDRWYWWRTRVYLQDAVTAWVPPYRFRTNAENSVPTAPPKIGPPDGATVDTLQPTLRAGLAMDQDEDQLRYIFRIYESDGEIRTSGEGQVNGMEIHFETPPLIENSTMRWDVVAIDEVSAESQSEAPWTLSVDTENTPPSRPTISSPSDGDTVATLAPSMIAEGSVDEDGDAIHYRFAVRRPAGETVANSGEVSADADGTATWTVDTPLQEDTEYVVAVLAQDARGAVSEETTVGIFVSAVNAPPSVPVHLSPANGSDVFGDSAILVWSPSEDPERTEIEYVVEFCVDEMCRRGAPQVETSFSLTDEVEEGQSYTWRVEAFDADGVVAGPTEFWSFRVYATNRMADSMGEAAEGCGCVASTHSSKAPSEFIFLFLVVWGWRQWTRSR